MSNITQKIEWAWCAGLFEGEGSLSGIGPPFVLTVTSTDKDVVDRFWLSIECGRVYGPYPKGPYKPYFRWHCGDRSGILRFEKRIAHMLQPRRLDQLAPAFEYAHNPIKKSKSSCFNAKEIT